MAILSYCISAGSVDHFSALLHTNTLKVSVQSVILSIEAEMHVILYRY